jgi:hypothetical protein
MKIIPVGVWCGVVGMIELKSIVVRSGIRIRAMRVPFYTSYAKHQILDC